MKNTGGSPALHAEPAFLAAVAFLAAGAFLAAVAFLAAGDFKAGFARFFARLSVVAALLVRLPIIIGSTAVAFLCRSVRRRTYNINEAGVAQQQQQQQKQKQKQKQQL
jgi:hypothetical protein